MHLFLGKSVVNYCDLDSVVNSENVDNFKACTIIKNSLFIFNDTMRESYLKPITTKQLDEAFVGVEEIRGTLELKGIFQDLNFLR